jgi:PAS domain S-box-containing protein
VQDKASMTNRVLLIEDNPGDARLVEILLMESDLLECEVINKTSLGDGMALLEKGEEFAAILLDLTLPDSRGFETLERLLTKFPNNNVIVLTGLADKRLGLMAVKAGAQDFLVKGAFDSDLLAKSLRFSIERSHVLKRLEETQRIANIGNWEFNPATGAFQASEEIYRIFGFPPRTTIFTGQDIQSPQSSFYLFHLLHQEVMEVGKMKKDVKIRQQNGGMRFAYVQCEVGKKADNSLVIHGILQDISDRKLTEQEMVKSQERYQEIFSQSKDAIFICTLDGKFVDFNQSTIDLFGYEKNELSILRDAHDLYYPSEKKNEFLMKLKTQKSVKDFAIQVANKRGEVRHCVITANILITDDFIGYNCICRDVTERKSAEKLRKARDLANQSAKMKEQFIASVSHEMRTPMNAVLGMSNILVQMDLKEEPMNLVKSIKQSSEILLGVVNDILEISAIQNGKIVFSNQHFDLQSILDNLVNVMQYKAQEKDMFIEIIMEEGIPQYLQGDKLRLNQILYNLVGNAIKFTDEGFVKIYIKKLNDILDSVQLQFIVEDSGIGIAFDKVDAVFETFTRIRQKDRIFEGTGLGLSICKNLVEQQGGKIGAISEEGIGSKFFFDLIFEIGDSDQVNDGTVEVQEIDFDESLPFNLLLVEDHKMNQIVAKKTLTRRFENINLTIAGNGQIAVDLLKEKSFDIILMDIQMPVMDGYEATKYIREEMPEEVATMPILAMTAHAHIAKDEKFKEYGMDDFVLKPFEPEDLFYKIKKYISQNKK